MSEKLFFVFDVESVGLHGEGYAYGYVVVDQTGKEIEAGSASCNPHSAAGDAAGRKWIGDNCPAFVPSHETPSAVRHEFMAAWHRWKDRDAVMVADCPWPVEASFLNDCVTECRMEGPYPLIDVGSVVLACGGDPTATFARRENELPRHDPLCDARQSARILIDHIRCKVPA